LCGRFGDGRADACPVEPTSIFENFVPIKTGDPLFISFDGEVINYTGTQELYPYLVNEAAYYAYNLAFHLMEKTEVKITL
jgi:aspartoacylase